MNAAPRPDHWAHPTARDRRIFGPFSRVVSALSVVAVAAGALVGITHGRTVMVDGHARASLARLPYPTEPPRPVNLAAADVEPALLDESAVRLIFSNTVSFPIHERDEGLTDTAVEPVDCDAMFNPPLRLYNELGGLGARVTVMKSEDRNRPQIFQSAVVLPSEQVAQDAVDRVTKLWDRCSIRRVQVGDGEGPLTDVASSPSAVERGIPTMSWKMRYEPWWGCDHAIGHRFNVVVDVSVCGQPIVPFARQIALRVVANLPTR